MSDTYLTIREMCDAYDVTARTLRFYEAKELLFPVTPYWIHAGEWTIFPILELWISTSSY